MTKKRFFFRAAAAVAFVFFTVCLFSRLSALCAPFVEGCVRGSCATDWPSWLYSYTSCIASTRIYHHLFLLLLHIPALTIKFVFNENGMRFSAFFSPPYPTRPSQENVWSHRTGPALKKSYRHNWNPWRSSLCPWSTLDFPHSTRTHFASIAIK